MEVLLPARWTLPGCAKNRVLQDHRGANGPITSLSIAIDKVGTGGNGSSATETGIRTLVPVVCRRHTPKGSNGSNSALVVAVLTEVPRVLRPLIHVTSISSNGTKSSNTSDGSNGSSTTISASPRVA